MNLIDEITNAVTLEIPESEVFVTSNDDVHFSLRIVSSKLSKLNRIEQHKMIYQSLKKRFGENWSNTIHALEIIVEK